MWFKHRAWIWVAWILAIINLLSVPLALFPPDVVHAGIHAVAAVAFGSAGWRLMVRRRALAHSGFLDTAGRG
jgi:hypothetical protein